MRARTVGAGTEHADSNRREKGTEHADSNRREKDLQSAPLNELVVGCHGSWVLFAAGLRRSRRYSGRGRSVELS